MSLSKKQCTEVCKALTANAKAKFNEAELLAGNESYGTASSLMITSMEESIKAFVLALDGCGFQFRSRAPEIKTIFYQHGLRYQFAFILSFVTVFVKDFQYLADLVSTRFDFTNWQLDADKIIRWIKTKIHAIKKEIEWFEEIASHREHGLYFDIGTEMIDPKDISERQYRMVAQRVKRTLAVVDFFQLMAEEPKSLKNLKELQKQFFSERWYKKINEFFSRVNSNRGPIFTEVKEMVLDFQEVFEEQKTFEEIEQNLEKVNSSLHQIKSEVEESTGLN